MYCYHCIHACSVAQSCLTLCDPMDCNPPGSSVFGILQARMLECVAMPSFRGLLWPRNQTYVSCIAGRFFSVSLSQGSTRVLFLQRAGNYFGLCGPDSHYRTTELCHCLKVAAIVWKCTWLCFNKTLFMKQWHRFLGLQYYHSKSFCLNVSFS